MKKPSLILKDHLLVPVSATGARIAEIRRQESRREGSAILDGQFVMLVSYLESMQKEVLKYYLKHHPEKLSEKKSIDIDKSLLAASYSLVERLASAYVERLPSQRLQELFFDALGLVRPASDQAVAAVRKRRNKLVHANLSVDLKQESARGDHISFDNLSDALAACDTYVADIENQVSRLYARCTRLSVLKKLWRYTFLTPLCASFDDYWAADSDKDRLIGFKTTRVEEGLSHSERFMLGIWRSQVSPYNVEFVNMASLGDRMRACLYMFLQLQEDIFMY
jgi:hypothetical protein